MSSQHGNEAQIGAALSEVFADWIVKRPDVWVTGKVWPEGTACPTPAHVRCQVSTMLAALKLDHFDLCLLPAHNNMTAFKVRHITIQVPRYAYKGAHTPPCILLSLSLIIIHTSGLHSVRACRAAWECDAAGRAHVQFK